MNKRIVLALSALSLFCTLAALNAFALDECSAYKFIHVKTGYGNDELWQFHGLADASNHEEFQVTADTYNNEFVCGILLQTELPAARDPVAVLWSAKKGKLKKEGTSIKKDLWNYHLCGDLECGIAACKCGGRPLIDETSCKAYTESGESGAAGAWELMGAEETLKQPYGTASTEKGDKALAESETKYRPKYDILCGGDERWHACDKPGCRCIMDYACTEDNKWVLCPTGCVDVNGKAVCKEVEAVKDCEENVVAEGSTMVPGNKEELCSIDKATLTGVSGEKATFSIEYLAGSGKKQKTVIVECSSEGKRTVVETEERDGGEPKTCYIECFSTFMGVDGRKMAQLNLCYEIPEPEKKEPEKVDREPNKFTPPVEEVQEPEPKPERAEFKEPETTCEEYYGIIRIEGEDTETPKVDDPCGFLETLEVDKSKQCRQVGGTLEDKYYDLIDIPPCTPSIKDFFEVGGDVFVNVFGEDEEVPEGECGGKITDFSHHLEGDEIEITISFINTGEETCIYWPCISGVDEETWETKECASEKIALKPWESGTSTISSEGTNIKAFIKNLLKGETEELNIEDLTSWDVEDLGGKYKITLMSEKESGGEEKEVDSEESPVCNDEALILCSTPDMKYGVLDSTKYVTLAKEQIDGNIDKFWVLNVESFHLMDVEECVDNGDESSEIKFYTIADFDKYRKYTEDSFGKESSYIKYTDMFFQDLADYIYCYKTDIRNTSVCSEINLEWYSVSKDRTQRYIDEDYLDDVRYWNKNQNVTEITPVDKGEPDIKPNYEPLYCAVSMDQDFYRPGDTITITYTSAPKGSTLNLYRWNKDEEMWEWTGESWTVENSGTETYRIKADEKSDRFRASLYSGNGECRPVDGARIGITALSSVMSQAFMLTPLLEDTRNDMLWTETGKGILYAGSGFDRYDACELSCDAKDLECRIHPDCDHALGAYGGECDDCINKGDCTKDSGGVCGGPKGDCWDNICRVESSFDLEADVGGESFNGIPYEGDCPEGFGKKDVTAYAHSWSEDPLGKTETKCVVEGGIIGKTYFEFEKEIPEAVDMVFIVDTSGSITDTREEWDILCNNNILGNVVKRVEEAGVKEVTFTIYTLDASLSCRNKAYDGKITVLTAEELRTIDSDTVRGELSWNECWGAGTEWVMKNHPWTPDAKRLIFPISDEDADHGNDAGDYKSGNLKNDGADEIESAIENANGAIVYGLWGNNAIQEVRDEMERLSSATGGRAHLFTDEKEVEDIIVSSISSSYTELNDAEIKFEQVKGRDNVWELWQEEDIEYEYTPGTAGGGEPEKGEKILIYVMHEYTNFDVSGNLRSAGYVVDYKVRSGQGEVTDDLLKDYTQLWLINGEDKSGLYLTESEKNAIIDFRENRGDILISVDHTTDNIASDSYSYQRMLNPIAEHFGVRFSGTWTPGSTCITEGKTYDRGVLTLEEHDFNEGVSTVSSSNSDAFMKITEDNSDGRYKVLGWIGSEPYGTILLDEGYNVGRVVFDNSFARFYGGSAACKGANDAKYHVNIANWLARRLAPESHVETGPIKFTLKPSLHVTETGNMPFDILYSDLSKESDGRYVLTRLYKPEDPERKLIITSDIDLNYTLLETADSFRVEVNSTYVTNVRRDKYYTACDFVSCAKTGGGMGKKFVYAGCGGLSSVEEGYSRREILTEYVDSVESEKDVINVGGVSHGDVPCNTLDELTIEGTIEEYIDGDGEVVLASSLDDPMRITISPDILGGFVFRVGRSFIVYNSLFYPTKHHLFKKQGFSYPDVLWYGFDDRYGFEDEAYGFLQQCRKICPPFPVCRAEDGKPLEPECVQIQEAAMKWVAREDCVYPPIGCYLDPCTSKRTYHEEEGSFIANGDFESWENRLLAGRKISSWETVSGSAEQKFSGYSGYMLELNGEIEQKIPSLHTAPFHQLCLEYALKEDNAGGRFDAILTTEDGDEELSVWKSEPGKDCTLGWQKKCFPVQAEDITKIRLKSDFTVWVDNVNLGSYYDFVDLYTYDSSLIEYMDQNMKGWDEVGLLHTGGISHEDNTYTFELMSYPVMKIDFEKGMTMGSLTVENVKEGDITIQTFFQDILIPLAENTGEEKEEVEPEEKKEERILIYPLNENENFDISNELKEVIPEVDYIVRSKVGEITDEFLEPYTQVWLMDGCLKGEGKEELVLTAEEINALEKFRNDGGDLLLSADNTGCYEGVNPVANLFEVNFQGSWDPRFDCVQKTRLTDTNHPFWEGVEGISSTRSDAYMDITGENSDGRYTAISKLGSRPYGAILLNEGSEKGRVIFDNSFTRFYQRGYKCSIESDRNYRKNIAKWLSKRIEPDKPKEEERTGPCYTLNVNFRRATDLTLELNPSSYSLAPGTEVTVTATLVYHADKTPLEGQKVYFDLSGKDIWEHSPTGLYRDYMFRTGELSGNKEQQANLRDYLKAFRDDALLKEFDDGTYSIDVDGVNAYFVSSAGEKIILGGVGENGEVYETEEQRTLAYAVTNSEGVATFTYVPSGSVLNANAPGQAGSASSASTGLHVVEIKSPLFSGEFLLLVVILVFAVFSYRYFKDRKFDLYSWWKDYRGRK